MQGSDLSRLAERRDSEGQAICVLVMPLLRISSAICHEIHACNRLHLRSLVNAFQSLTEAIDTVTPTGRAMWQMAGTLAELERSLIQERTKAGRAAAAARGVQMGRKRLLSAQQVAHARKLIEQGEGPNNVAKSLNVSRRTLYRALRNPWR